MSVDRRPALREIAARWGLRRVYCVETTLLDLNGASRPDVMNDLRALLGDHGSEVGSQSPGSSAPLLRAPWVIGLFPQVGDSQETPRGNLTKCALCGLQVSGPFVKLCERTKLPPLSGFDSRRQPL